MTENSIESCLLIETEELGKLFDFLLSCRGFGSEIPILHSPSCFLNSSLQNCQVIFHFFFLLKSFVLN